jgi:uncharacterized SAM-binding protein YcdF (DUF218 family)
VETVNRRRRLIKVLALIFLLPVLLVLALAIRVDVAAHREPDPAKAPAIVVLGARVLPSGHAAPALQRRAEVATRLFLEGRAPLIFFSGGASGTQPSEASIARDIAVAAGVPATACVLEENSHSTADNAAFTTPLLRSRGISEVILVSDGYHLLRAQAHFKEYGITSHAVSTGRDLPLGERLHWTFREVFALLRDPKLLWRAL